MKQYVTLISSNGSVIVDDTPEAEIRLSNMEYAEERWNRENAKQKHYIKLLFWRIPVNETIFNFFNR